MNRKTSLLLALTLLYLPFDYCYVKWSGSFCDLLIPQNLPLPPWFDKRLYFYGTDLLAFLLFTAASIRPSSLSQQKELHWLEGLFIFLFLSIVFSPLGSYFTAYLGLLQWVSPWLFLQALRKSPPRSFTPFFICICIAASLQAALGLYQYFTQTPLGLKCLGELQDLTQAGEVHSSTGAQWIFDLFHPPQEAKDYARACGTLGHSNPLGGFLAAAILCLFSLYSTGAKKIRVFLSFLLFLLFCGLITTFSRAAFLGIFLASVLFFYKASPPPSLLWIAPLLFSFAVLLFAPPLLDRLPFFSHPHSSAPYFPQRLLHAETERIYQNRVALDTIHKYPWLGIGYRQLNYTPELNDWTTPKIFPVIHNSVLLLATESGLLSIVCLVMFFGALLKKGLSSPLSPPQASALAIVVLFLLIAQFDFYPLLCPPIQILLFFFCGALLQRAPICSFHADPKQNMHQKSLS